MFTGIIEDIGEVRRLIPQGGGARLVIASGLPLEEVKLGDSIAVCGACLTVVRIEIGLFEAEISRETVSRSTLASVRAGDRVHLERAMRLNDRLDGHLVLGHVDGVGEILRSVDQGDSLDLEISAPKGVYRYLVEKGSVAVHGVSLTVNALLEGAFAVRIVPFTGKRTFLSELKVGARVNLEADLLGKYVERLLSGQSKEKGGGGLTLEHLGRHGFLE